MTLRRNPWIGQSLYSVVTEQPGHPDQFLYSWLLTAQKPSPWAQVCYLGKGESEIFLAQAEPKQEKLKEIYYDSEEEELPPSPPYWGT